MLEIARSFNSRIMRQMSKNLFHRRRLNLVLNKLSKKHR